MMNLTCFLFQNSLYQDALQQITEFVFGDFLFSIIQDTQNF